MKKNTDSKSYFSLRSPQIICWAFFLFTTINLTSKCYSQLDSIRFHFNSKPTIGLKMETKNFVIQNSWTRIQELKPYLEYGKSLRLGLGYAWLKKGHKFIENTDTLYLKINALTFFAAYVYKYNKDWTIEIPLDFGIGNIKTGPLLEKGYYSFYEPSLILEYHGFKYVNLGLGTGFRVTGHQESIYPQSLTTQTFIFRFGVKFSEIYQQLKELTNT